MQRRFRRQAWSAAFAIASACACARGQPALAQANAPRAFPDVLELISPDAHAAVIIPNIKRGSDTLTRLLEGMDRANILLGSRPIDQFKSVTGYTTGVDDSGTAALVVIDADVQRPQLLWLMPVSDAEDFLTSNFTGRDGDAYTRSDGTRVFAAAIGAHVALSADQSTLQTYQAGEGSNEIVQRAMTGVAHNRFDACDVLLIARPPMIAALQHRVFGSAAVKPVPLPGVSAIGIDIAENVRTAIIGLELDPLGLIVHGVTEFADDSAFGVAVPAEHPQDAGLSRLPDQPLALAFSANLAAMGGARMLGDLATATGAAPDAVPAWLQPIDSVQLGVAPSPAGAAGGLLNGAMLAVACEDSEGLRASLKREIMRAPPANSKVQREAGYREHATLPDGVADMWEIRMLDAPPDHAGPQAQARMLESMLFGTAGIRGYVRQQPNTLLATFSQRPPLLKTLTDSVAICAAAIDDAAGGLGANASVRTIRRWLPRERDVEMYFNLGLLRQMIVPLLPAMLNADEALPTFDADLPPIGMAIDVEQHRACGAAVIPAGVLAPLFDEAMRAIRQPPRIEVRPTRK